MRILMLSSEVWNDKINGNNVTSNWFEGMDVEIANIYGSPGEPDNKCCTKYFQITDAMMAKSILTGKKAGKKVTYQADRKKAEAAEREPKKLYRFLKAISGSFMRLLRELIWLWGRYDIKGLKRFINEFRPDIIFTERMASIKMLRMERIVAQICDAPMVAFTGDDEYSLMQLSFSPFFWINRLMVRHMLEDNVKMYKIYYTLSAEQKNDYESRFGCDMRVIYKGGVFDGQYFERDVHDPIRFIYAGKLYCNRWRALADIVDAISEINNIENGLCSARLDIYTGGKVTLKQNRLLNDRKNSFLHSPVSAEELEGIYKKSDVALHVESQDMHYRLKNRLSFSTKITDCIFSGCAVLAYCWKGQTGWKYLKREHAAICVSDRASLKKILKGICCDPSIIHQYARKAYDCGVRNHLKKDIQKRLYEDLQSVISDK